MKKLTFVRTIILAASLLLQLSTLCFDSRGAAGDVDLSFDPGSGVNGTVTAVALQPDGKVIIGGQFTTVKGLTRNGLARLNADGSGDPTFNAGTNSGGAFALQPDGKLIVCLQLTDGNGSAARLNSDGTLDSSFVAAPGSYPYGSSFGLVVVQPDGKVLLGGQFGDVYFDNEGGISHYSHYLVVRLNANGTFDTSFAAASGGYDPYTDYGISSLVLQPDGKVLIGIWDDWTRRIARLNADGTPDSTFNPGTGPNSYLRSIVLQPDGKVLIGGYFTAVNGTNRSGLARLNANGTLDSSFIPGIGGAYPIISSIGLQPDGKVLIFGFFTAVNGTNRNGLARLNANGSLDGSFNPGTGIGGYYPVVNSFGAQADGKVLIGGNFTTVNGTNHNYIARLNANGSLDGSFDSGSGISPTPTSYAGVESVAVQPDGKVLIGGGFVTVHGTSRNGLARLNANGDLDSSFNPGTGANGDVRSVVVQSDGKVILGGGFTAVNGTNRNYVARLEADGSLDGGFNPGTVAGYVNSFVVQPDGKVLIGGQFTSVNGTNRNRIARLNANGSLDISFNPGLSAPGSDYFDVRFVALQSNGKVLIGGSHLVTFFDPDIGDYEASVSLLTRLSSDGSRDTSFEPVAGEGEPPGTFVQVVAAQPDGKVLFGGTFTTVRGASRNRIARLNTNGTLDTSFDPGSGANGPVYSLALQPDGKVLIGGDFTAINGTNRSRIARLNANGSLDSSFAWPNAKVSSIALQPDGNVLIGGGFTTVNGTARSYVARLYGDYFAPSLGIARSNASVIVSWPVTGLNFQLQENTDLSLPNSWSPVTQATFTNAGQVFLTIPISDGRRFFRLESQ